jgi:Zn-dependent peptidase ImmA (M78 family)
MTSLNELYCEADSLEIIVFYCPFKKNKSVSSPDRHIGIDTDKIDSTIEEKICLAHEIGHCMTGSFYNIYTPLDNRQKHEIRADRWAIKKLIPKNELDEAVHCGIIELWDLAEYFEVPESFMVKAIEFYKINQ